MASFNVDDANIFGQISPDSIQSTCVDVGRLEEVDGVFVSCTNMRIIERISEIENKIGKPVLSSNLALAWHALQLSNVDTNPASALAKLFQKSERQLLKLQ